MADIRRFGLFAAFCAERFPRALRVYDVAGGMGRLNEELTKLGRTTTTFDVRVKRLPVRYAERLFTLGEPCDADLVVGLHSDGATRLCIDYAAKHGIGFAVVPCCSENGMSYNPWWKHLLAHARQLGFAEVGEHELPMAGRARVVWGRFND
ncbi:MAG: hypothetical protein IPJ65_34945 [Archangiaceae bacterium]|nr:hypothetical protein [Archangiaceae bacterium]